MLSRTCGPKLFTKRWLMPFAANRAFDITPRKMPVQNVCGVRRYINYRHFSSKDAIESTHHQESQLYNSKLQFKRSTVIA